MWGTPKGHERREVPIPRFLVDELATHVAGKAPDDLVFTGVRGGARCARTIFRRAAFDRAASRIGMPDLHPHELRHTAASLAIASGANVKVVQQMLGHKSATMTLDQYGHLFGDRLDEVADADGRRRAGRCCVPVVYPSRHRRSWLEAGEATAQKSGPPAWCPRQDSNLRSRLRRAVLYPLSYGGVRTA